MEERFLPSPLLSLKMEILSLGGAFSSIAFTFHEDENTFSWRSVFFYHLYFPWRWEYFLLEERFLYRLYFHWRWEYFLLDDRFLPSLLLSLKMEILSIGGSFSSIAFTFHEDGITSCRRYGYDLNNIYYQVSPGVLLMHSPCRRSQRTALISPT